MQVDLNRVEIREATDSDLSDILDIIDAAFTREAAAYLKPHFEKGFAAGLPTFVTDYFGVVGLLFLEPVGNDVILDLIAVHPTYQGAGIGTKTLTWLFEHASAKGYKVIELCCPANEGGKDLYYLLGFTNVSRVMGAYPNGVDALRLKYVVPAKVANL